jgi:hypothetical protein
VAASRGEKINKQEVVDMFYRYLAVLISLVLSSTAFAATEEVSNTTYGVVIEQAREVKMENGTVVMTGGLIHGSSVQDNGEVNSQWCRGSSVMGDDGMPVAGGGYCTIIGQNGDMMFVWFGGGKWGVIGGTGAWAGATGGGTTEPVSQNPDGYAWVNRSKGTITTP